MTKLALLSTAALGLMVGAASAADLPSRRAPPPAAYVAVPVFTWTGFYVGGNVGYVGTDKADFVNSGNNLGTAATLFGARPSTLAGGRDGFTGGGQIGYNYQIGSFVVGLETDANYTDLKKTRTVLGSTGALSSISSDIGYIGTVRGRIGYSFDRLLVFATGGLAYGDVENTAAFYAPGSGVAQFSGSRSKTATGYAVGGGVEYALPTSFNMFGSNAVTLKGEALYYDLGSTSINVADTGAAPVALRGQSYTTRFDNSGVLARVGVNFKFGTY